jgi:hypothetical protein
MEINKRSSGYMAVGGWQFGFVFSHVVPDNPSTILQASMIIRNEQCFQRFDVPWSRLAQAQAFCLLACGMTKHSF